MQECLISFIHVYVCINISHHLVFCSYKKSYTFHEDMSARFVSAIPYNLLQSTYNKLPQHWEVRNIAQHSKESTWTNMEMTSFASEESFYAGGGGGKLLSIEKYQHKDLNLSTTPN